MSKCLIRKTLDALDYRGARPTHTDSAPSPACPSREGELSRGSGRELLRAPV